MATQALGFIVPAGYSRRDEVSDKLGVSDATIERMVSDGRLGSQLVKVPGRKSERVYLTDDVMRLKAEKEKRAEKRPPLLTEGSEEGKGALVSVKTSSGFTVANLRELLGEWSAQRQVPDVREKLWLTWEEAGQLSGIPPLYVRDLAGAGKIVARKFGRSWRVLRASLEAYEG